MSGVFVRQWEECWTASDGKLVASGETESEARDNLTLLQRKAESEKLGDGETVWDDWSREDLLVEVRKLYRAAASARDTLQRHFVSSIPYWTDAQGVGARTMRLLDASLNRYRGQEDDLYRAYYRLRDNLLFGVGEPWYTCPQGHCYGPRSDGTIGNCQICQEPLSLLTWDHLTDKVKP